MLANILRALVPQIVRGGTADISPTTVGTTVHRLVDASMVWYILTLL